METALTTPSFVSTFSFASLRVDSRAAVLGATLAFGSCTLAGCGDDDAERAVDVPALAATAPSPEAPLVVEPEEAPPAPELDFDTEEGRVSTFGAGPGFTPDPMTHPGTTAGGPIDAHLEDEHCHGWVGPQPDFVITATRAFAELSLMVASSADTSLFVIGPDGGAHCTDDDEGRDPRLRERFAPGVYRVWVGTATQGTEEPFLLALSELDETTPSQLAH